MRLAGDERARVPFAIVGIVLILGSATYVTTLQERGPSPTDPDAELARERLDAAIDAEIGGAIRRAARAAAREPVVDPADTRVGRLLNESTPFRDYLRIRIYHEVRRTLADVHVSTGAVSGGASLPPTPDVDALREAMARIEVEHGSERGTIAVRIEDVTLRLLRDGATIRQRQRTITKTVTSPVLVLHDRVETFQERLDRGPLDGPGFGRYFAAGLYSFAWARGYLQYTGVPIQNVIATRHVEVVTNGALLRTQRSVFGRGDPAGRTAMTRAVTHAGIHDVLAVSRMGGRRWMDTVFDLGRGVPAPSTALPPPRGSSFDAPGPNAEITVGVNVTADAAFADLLDHRTEPSLNATIETVYSADVRLRSARRTVRTERPPEPDPPAGNWTLVDETVETTTTVSNATGPEPPVTDGWQRLRSYTRHVEVHKTVTWTWTTENDSADRETSAAWTNVSRVGVALDARHSPTERVPRHGIESVFEPGGPFDGPNLADVETAAVRRLVHRRGGPDVLAKRAARDALDDSSTRIKGEYPEDLTSRVYQDLAEFRERLRDVNVTVPRGQAGIGTVNAAETLLRELQVRRASLVDAPATYDSVAEKARFAARAAYVSAVIEVVRGRATRTDQRVEVMNDELGEFGSDVAAEVMTLDPEEPSWAPLYVGPDGPVEGAVTTSPAYLTVQSIPGDRLPAVDANVDFHPLVTRNHNLIAAPYGDIADAIIGELLGEDAATVGLETAALALASANRTLAGNATDSIAGNATDRLVQRRDELNGAILGSLQTVTQRLVEVLIDRTNLAPEDRRMAVYVALDQWNTVHARALAVVNGSVAQEVAAEAGKLTNPSFHQQDRLQVELRMELASLVEAEDVRVDRQQVNETATATRHVARDVTQSAIEAMANRTVGAMYERWAGRHLVSVPAGLLLTPVPGFWYATANAWNVSTRGTYARFAVDAQTGTPRGGTTVSYVRDGDAVELDVFGNGDPVVLGRTTRISFELTVPVVVVVPPGGRGVGDVYGTADERSGGWPEPGSDQPTRARVTTPYVRAR